jgi:hypothetical protein
VHGDPNFLSDAAQAERIAMNTSELRQKFARYIVAIDTEVKDEEIKDEGKDNNRELFFSSFFVQYMDKKIKERLDEVGEKSNLGKLEKCVNDYNLVPTYLGRISEKFSPNVTFQIGENSGILVAKRDGKYLVVLSDGTLAEVFPLDANGNLYDKSEIKTGITFNDATKYGKDEELAHALEKNIGIINIMIQNMHKHKFPKLYNAGGYTHMSDSDLIAYTEEVDAHMRKQYKAD